VDDLEDRLDALFAGPPGEFTAARAALVKELRAAGEREAAERAGALRRPTKLAAELNRLAREEADALATAIAATEALAGAQGAMLEGRAGPEELKAAAAAEAEALAALSDDVAVRAAVRAAALREDERGALRRGRLSREPEPDLAAGGLLGGAPPPPPARPRRAAAPDPPPVDELAARRARRVAGARSERAEARQLAKAAAQNAQRADKRLAEARRAREAAERAREKAESRLARVRADLEEAERAQAAAADEARRAADAEAGAAAEAEEAARLVEEAEGVVARLDEPG
jgi:hypothetical protein